MVGRFTTKDTHWNVGNMIYGDNPIKINDVLMPDLLAIRQSGNLYLYCADDPVQYIDEDGNKLAFPGEIHQAVQKRIAYKMGIEGTQMRQEVSVFNGNTYLGRADLVQIDGNLAYVWEVKPSKSRHINAGRRQLARYLSGNCFKTSDKTTYGLSPGYDLPGETFTYKGILNDYRVTYRSIGDGIITYDYQEINSINFELYAKTVAVALVVTIVVLAGMLALSSGSPLVAAV